MGLFSFLFGNKTDQIQEYLDKGALILDVRTRGEFQGGHINNAVHIPLKEINNRSNQIKKLNKPVIAYCASGMRSGSATGILKSKGIDAINGGGINTLKKTLEQ